MHRNETLLQLHGRSIMGDACGCYWHGMVIGTRMERMKRDADKSVHYHCVCRRSVAVNMKAKRAA